LVFSSVTSVAETSLKRAERLAFEVERGDDKDAGGIVIGDADYLQHAAGTGAADHDARVPLSGEVFRRTVQDLLHFAFGDAVPVYVRQTGVRVWIIADMHEGILVSSGMTCQGIDKG
jgi:hypothetical protein